MTGFIPIRPAEDAKITPENKCGFCRSKTCCSYFTQHIDTPRSMEDFDLMLWQISHHSVQIFKDADGWFLLVNQPCRHLQPDGRCGIYEQRPQVCREYTNEDCEFDGPSGPEDFELFFPDYESLLAYCRRRFRGWERRFDKKKAAGGRG
jgi:Fe-S-cluster containining protein